MKDYLDSHGITQTTADQMGLSFDADKNRLVIPVRDGEGKFLFNKYRNLGHSNDSSIPKFTYDSGSAARLYNLQAIKNSEYAFIFEGECFRGDAEILTPEGWIQFNDYKGQQVLQYEDEETSSFVTPLAYISKKYTGPLVELSNTQLFYSLTTPNHNLIIKCKDKLLKIPADQLNIDGKKHIPRVTNYNGEGIQLTNNQIKLCIAVSADFTIRKEGDLYACFKKQRKVTRLIQLLHQLKIPFSNNIDSRGYHSIFIKRGNTPKYIFKLFPHEWIFKSSLSQKKLILQEILYWDGNSVPNRKQIEYSSIEYSNVLFIQTIAHLSGYVSTIISRKNQFGEWYKVSILLNKKYTSAASIVRHKKYIKTSEQVFCVQVQSGMLVVRQNGCISISGNCDTIKATEDQIPAVCGTSGAGTFEPEWAEQLVGKKIFICYDNDRAGEEGLAKVLELIPDAIPLKLPEECKDYCEYRLKYSAKDFQKLVATVIQDNTLSYHQFTQVIDKWLLLPDKNVLKVLFACLISHYFTADPLWIFLVAPPSGTKTELITLLSALPIVYMLSSLTEKTLFSGLEGRREESPSLMMRIPNSIITMKDFTSILSMRQEEKMNILGQLREIYDGRYDRAFGTGFELHWTGRITLIGGVTGIIDAQHTLFQTMGERFVMYRVLQPCDEEVAIKALSNSGQETQMRQELKVAMRKFFWGIKIPKISEIDAPAEIIKALSALASFIVIARSGILRNSYGAKEIELIPEPEAPPRLAKQLGILIKALAVLAGRKVVTWEDYYLTLRVALDTVPRNKISHLVALIGGTEDFKTSQIAATTGYSIAGAEMMLEDLYALKLVSKSDWGQGYSPTWHLSEKCLGYLGKILPHPSKLLDEYFTTSDFYRPLIDKCLNKASEGKFIQSLDTPASLVA